MKDRTVQSATMMLCTVVFQVITRHLRWVDSQKRSRDSNPRLLQPRSLRQCWYWLLCSSCMDWTSIHRFKTGSHGTGPGVLLRPSARQPWIRDIFARGRDAGSYAASEESVSMPTQNKVNASENLSASELISINNGTSWFQKISPNHALLNIFLTQPKEFNKVPILMNENEMYRKS